MLPSLSELLEPEDEEELDDNFDLFTEGGSSAPGAGGSGVGFMLERSGLISCME